MGYRYIRVSAWGGRIRKICQSGDQDQKRDEQDPDPIILAKIKPDCIDQSLNWPALMIDYLEDVDILGGKSQPQVWRGCIAA